MQTFDLSGDYIELNKLLKASSLCGSGGEANAAISGGAVKVNGLKEGRKRRKLRRGDVVEMAGKTIRIN